MDRAQDRRQPRSRACGWTSGEFSLEKLVKKWFKHIVWLGIALWTGFTFVGYFTPIRELGLAFLQTRMGSWEVFWVLFYGFATYGNAGFMREQVCMYMCPYARFQSAMFDRDTLIVSYDARARRAARRAFQGQRRPRAGPRRLHRLHPVRAGLPDRHRHPQGPAVRVHRLRACVDACDTVMDKMATPRGLIRYATQNGMAGHWTRRQVLRRVLRPRVLIYAGVLMALDRRPAREPGRAHAAQGRRGARPRLAGAHRRRAASSRTSTACRS